jgi:hypothetical protein
MSKKRYRLEEIIGKLRETVVLVGQRKTLADKCPSGVMSPKGFLVPLLRLTHGSEDRGGFPLLPVLGNALVEDAVPLFESIR